MLCARTDHGTNVIISSDKWRRTKDGWWLRKCYYQEPETQKHKRKSSFHGRSGGNWQVVHSKVLIRGLLKKDKSLEIQSLMPCLFVFGNIFLLPTHFSFRLYGVYFAVWKGRAPESLCACHPRSSLLLQPRITLLQCLRPFRQLARRFGPPSTWLSRKPPEGSKRQIPVTLSWHCSSWHLFQATHLSNYIFDGARADLTKSLSVNPLFQVTHSFALGSQTLPSSYNFGAIFANQKVFLFILFLCS